MMPSLILSGLSNLADGGQFCADTRLVGSDGVSFRVHWPLLLARGVWWAKCVDQVQEDGDRVILIPENSRELRQFVDNLYCEYLCHGWSDVGAKALSLPTLRTWTWTRCRMTRIAQRMTWRHQRPARALLLVKSPMQASSPTKESLLTSPTHTMPR